MGRPPLTSDQVRRKVLLYCARYHASLTPRGFPVFPAGKRESRQHRDRLTVYRAVMRLQKRQQAPVKAEKPQICPTCHQVIPK